MADSSPEKQPKPTQTSDPHTVERTVKFLWTNRRINQFKVRATLKKMRAAESELQNAKTQVKAFSLRLDREFDKHPEVFKKMGLSPTQDESSED
jgi:hypothetical protein